MATVHVDDRRRERLLVIGGGMAAFKLVEELVARDPERFDISIAAREPHLPYNRVLLSSLLAGEVERGDLELKSAAWYAEHRIEVLTGVEVSALRPMQQQVVLSTGRRLAYDRVVLATGSKPIRLPIPGSTLPGVVSFRDLRDASALECSHAGSRAIVIGGGLLGVEAACGLAKRGVAVALVHLMPRLMERQLDERAAGLLGAELEKRGIELVLGAETAGIEGSTKAEGVVLKDGRTFSADLIVMAIGIRPETGLAESSGIDTGRGVKVDDKLETNWPGVYAIGECIEHRGVCYGLVEPVHAQARVLAQYLSGRPARYEGSTPASSLKVSGVPVFSLGDFEGIGAESIVLEDQTTGSYRKLVIRGNRLAGLVLFGDTSDALWYRDLMEHGAPVPADRAMLALGRAYAEAA